MMQKLKRYLTLAILSSFEMVLMSSCGSGNSDNGFKGVIPPRVYFSESVVNLKAGESTTISIQYFPGNPPQPLESNLYVLVSSEQESIATVNPRNCVLNNTSQCAITISGIESGSTIIQTSDLESQPFVLTEYIPVNISESLNN